MNFTIIYTIVLLKVKMGVKSLKMYTFFLLLPTFLWWTWNFLHIVVKLYHRLVSHKSFSTVPLISFNIQPYVTSLQHQVLVWLDMTLFQHWSNVEMHTGWAISHPNPPQANSHKGSITSNDWKQLKCLWKCNTDNLNDKWFPISI